MIGGERMSWNDVLSWARSDNVELMGAAAQALMSNPAVIDGDIDDSEADRFMVRYLVLVIEGRAVRADVFQMQPYVAAHELARWYKHWHGLRPPSDDTLKYAREELSRLYLSGDQAQQRRVVDGVLEHIFEEPSCREDFEEWKDHPVLVRAIEEAEEWVRAHP